MSDNKDQMFHFFRFYLHCSKSAIDLVSSTRDKGPPSALSPDKNSVSIAKIEVNKLRLEYEHPTRTDKVFSITDLIEKLWLEIRIQYTN